MNEVVNEAGEGSTSESDTMTSATTTQQYYEARDIIGEQDLPRIRLLLSKPLVLPEAFNNQVFTGSTAVEILDIIYFTLTKIQRSSETSLTGGSFKM